MGESDLRTMISEILNQIVKERTNSLEHSISLLRSTLESSVDGILVTDLEGKIIDFNQKFTSIWNISEELIKSNDGKYVYDHMLNQLQDSSIYHTINEMLNKDINSTNKQIVTFKNGSIIECYAQPHTLNDKVIGRVWSYHDITERALLEKKLEFQASHDTLTGLPNRLLVLDRIMNAMERADRYKNGIAVLFIDLDRFKLINDSFSHATGDQMLTLVAARLSTLVRKEDTLARLGGDEFVMLITELEKDEYALTVASKVLNSFKEPFTISGQRIVMSASIGISIYPADHVTIEGLLRNADLAMYQAKRDGGNQYKFYTKQLNDQTNKRYLLETELTRALANDEFFLVYQPQLDINNQSMITIEALLRWNHPERGCLTPIEFIQVAEESGLIIPIGEWVMRAVCAQIKIWQQKELPKLSVAINIATQQLKQNNFAEIVKEILDEHQVEPNLLEFEIKENILMTHLDVISMINRLKDLGIKIVLDDFGTGNSVLNYLKLIEIDRLKIDPSFIKNISHSHADEVIIEAIIAMSHSFNFKVLAEGVESENQMDYLKKQSCDQIQGYIFSHPLSADTLEQFLKEKR